VLTKSCKTEIIHVQWCLKFIGTTRHNTFDSLKPPTLKPCSTEKGYVKFLASVGETSNPAYFFKGPLVISDPNGHLSRNTNLRYAGFSTCKNSLILTGLKPTAESDSYFTTWFQNEGLWRGNVSSLQRQTFCKLSLIEGQEFTVLV
jgi:hypothetical protein